MVRIKASRKRTRVVFKKRTLLLSSPMSTTGQTVQIPDFISDEKYEKIVFTPPAATEFMIPDLYKIQPRVRDAHATASSNLQDETVSECLPYLMGQDADLEYNEYGIPRLHREKHAKFLHKSLGKLPARFVAADASRPWFLYWCLSGLALLREDTTKYRVPVAETAQSMQNDTGGFGSGGRQLSHLATSYAIVLSLALVGGEDAFEVVDRRAMWKWLCSLKQPSGGFQVCLGGEEDIRGAYCATLIITLLNIPLNLGSDSPAAGVHTDLLSGLPDYVRRCQTFEGGISARPQMEAHGGYAFCALGCLALLDRPDRMIPRYLDVARLLSWLSSRQYAPEGGFSGRTNKLVDGCYSHWVGACFPLIEACLSGSGTSPSSGLPAASESLFDREGLIRYILCCCQDISKRGGLRDKPGKLSDPYHTCYVLSGLSSAQHRWQLDLSDDNEFSAEGSGTKWTVSPYLDGAQRWGDEHRVQPIHPVYIIPQASQEAMRNYFMAKRGF